MTILRSKTIQPRNAYLARQSLRDYVAASDSFEPWTGRSDVRVRFSVEPTGFDSHGVESTLFGPYDMTESSGEPGTYAVAVPVADVTDALSSLVGSTIYQVVEGGFDGTDYALTDVLALVVTEPRQPQPGSV